jgi:hypothetical protein
MTLQSITHSNDKLWVLNCFKGRVFSYTKMMYDWYKPGHFFKRLSETKQKTSRAHVHFLGRNILLLSLKPKQLKPVQTKHVGFCSCLLLIPESSNPKKFFVQLYIKHFKKKMGYQTSFESVYLLFMTTLWQWLSIIFIFLLKRSDLS